MNTIPVRRRGFGKFCVLTLALFLAACGGGSDGGGATLSANAGADQTVNDAATVTLDGSASSGASSFAWTQTTGPDVVLNNASAQRPSFTAPTVAGGTTLAFTLTVSDGSRSATDAVTVTVTDVTAATAKVSPTPAGELDLRGSIEVTFSEAMDPASLELAGVLGRVSDGGSWNAGNTVLTISPDELGAWESGRRSLGISVDDASGNATSVDASFDITLDFTTFQAASTVIGQAGFSGQSANQGGAADANTFSSPYGAAWDDESGTLYVADYSNNRVLGFIGIPTANNANADLVIGQGDFTTTATGLTATTLNGPYLLTAGTGKLFVNDFNNKRIAIYDPAPIGAGATIDTVIGQVDKTSNATGCTASNLQFIESIGVTPDGKVVVQDYSQDRALIFNTTPTSDGEEADLVLGQDDLVTCGGDAAASAASLNEPGGVWTDGEKLVMLNYANRRVMIWNEFPTGNNEEADIVLGQPDFDTVHVNDPDTGTLSARMMLPYTGVWSNGLQLFVADVGSNRLLIWNTFPTSNFQPADVVLGHGDFTLSAKNDDDEDGFTDPNPTARVFNNGPSGIVVARDKLIAVDSDNHRVLVFESN